MLNDSRIIKAFDKCSLVFNKNKLSYFEMLYSNIKFLASEQYLGASNRCIVLYPGTNIFVVIASVLYGLRCLLLDEGSSVDIVESLTKGDTVIYGNSRGVFDKINEEGMAVIIQANHLISYVPPKLFYKIKPYYGNAKALDGRGIKDDYIKRRMFLCQLLDMEESEIPNQISRSVVIVCEKQLADLIVNETVIEYGEGKRIPLRNVFASAYYTPNDVNYYAGNSSKTEPVFKFTSKISVARELIIEDRNKNIIGLIVNGKAIVDSGISELINLLSRRSLKNVCIMSRIDCGDHKSILEQYPELKLFAWTSDAILANKILNINEKYLEKNENTHLLSLVENTIKRNTELVRIEISFDTEIYTSIKASLLKIAKNEFSSKEKDNFVITGFSLLNLFTYSIFPMRIFENMATANEIAISSPLNQINKLNEIADSFSGLMRDEMNNVTKALYSFYNEIFYENPKHNYIFEQIMYGSRHQRIAIVIPKAYYSSAFSTVFKGRNNSFLKNIEFVTANRFDNEKMYDEIIVTGTFGGKYFNPLNCNSSSQIKVLAYSFEQNVFNGNSRTTQKLIQFYNSRNSIKYDYENIIEHDIAIKEQFELDIALEEYFNTVSLHNYVSSVKEIESNGQSSVEIVRVATFETGENIFFTKNYTPYVFDAITESVTETEVDKLVSGDILVFANKNNETRDIVDEILLRLVQSEKSEPGLKEAYTKSKYWKTVLENYMKLNDVSFRELSEKMKILSHGKHEVTLRSWLDEDSHIVGPRDAESFYAIALITDNPEILNNPEAFCEACKYIRSMRIRILKYIGIFIINSISRIKKNTDELIASIIGDVGEMAITLQVEKIMDVKDLSVPMYIVNRPLRQT